MAGLFIKLDVDFWDHPKIVTAGVMAGVLYQRMSMYCMQHTTDGYVPAAQLPRFALPATAKLTAALVSVGLIERADGGWLVPGYVERYPTAAELERKRQVDIENGKKGGRPRKATETQGVSDEKPQGLSAGLCDTKPRRNQEVEVEVDVEEQSSSDTSAARPPAPDDDDLPSRIWAMALIASPRPGEGDRATIAAAQRRGWTPDQLLAKAGRAARAEHDVTGYLRKVLTECANSDPPTERTTPAPAGADDWSQQWTLMVGSRSYVANEAAKKAWHDTRMVRRDQTETAAKFAFRDAYLARITEVPA